MNEEHLLTYSQRFVQDLEGQHAFQADWLATALLRVRRHLFIERYYDLGAGGFVSVDPAHPTDEQLRVIYSDRGWMIREPPHHSAASQPSLVLGMLADLQLEPGQRVLEIGTGSGWNAGLLSVGVGDDRLVYSMDIQPDLVDKAKAHLSAAGFPRVNLKVGDGGYGWAEEAPFDRIIVTVGCPDIPPAWHEQLGDDGVLLLPLKTGGLGDPILRLRKREGQLTGGFTRGSGFVTLQGDFWNRSHDLLEPRRDALVEELLSQEPSEAPLAEPMSPDCLFFLRLKGAHFQALLPPDGELAPVPTLLEREPGAILVASGEDPSMQVHGELSAAGRVALGQQEWIALGRPRITDYKVDLLDPGADIGDGWADKRPHATLRFSLGAAGTV